MEIHIDLMSFGLGIFAGFIVLVILIFLMSP